MINEEYEIIYSKESYEDMKDIYYYISSELNVPNSAKKVILKIQDKIEKLSYMPHKFKKFEWEPWESLDTHQMVVDNYKVLYIIDDVNLKINVLRIVYGARDLSKI